MRFIHQPHVYKSFLDLLHSFSKQQITIPQVYAQVSELLRDHPDLLAEFATFPPEPLPLPTDSEPGSSHDAPFASSSTFFHEPKPRQHQRQHVLSGSHLTQALLLVGLLYKGGKLGADERQTVKLIAFDRSGKYDKLKDAIVAALECFQVDKDFDNAADTLFHVCQRYRCM